jgi:hypothetical protein
MLVTLPIAAALIVSSAPSVAKKKRTRPGPARVIEVLDGIEANLVETKYQHVTRVRPKRGEYFFDCSGMTDWVLRRGAPAAARAVGRPEGRRPLAIHYYRRIAKIKPGKKRGPWLRVDGPAAARPGDVIAWERPKWFPSKSTGHVGFIVSEPEPNRGPVPGYLVRFADASKFKHEDDSRDEETTGYGTGVLLIPVDQGGRARGYGWVGSLTRPEWVIPCNLVIGRPLR